MNAVEEIYYRHSHYNPHNLEACADFGDRLEGIKWLAETLDRVLPHPMTDEYTIEYAVRMLMQCVRFYCNPHDLAEKITFFHSLDGGPTYYRLAIEDAIIEWRKDYENIRPAAWRPSGWKSSVWKSSGWNDEVLPEEIPE